VVLDSVLDGFLAVGALVALATVLFACARHGLLLQVGSMSHRTIAVVRFHVNHPPAVKNLPSVVIGPHPSGASDNSYSGEVIWLFFLRLTRDDASRLMPSIGRASTGWSRGAGLSFWPGRRRETPTGAERGQPLGVTYCTERRDR
jgi:hypothetical protein